MKSSNTLVNSEIFWRGKKYSIEELESVLNIQLKQKDLQEWERDILIFALDWLLEKNHFFTIQTSGSTGEPKKIQISRDKMIQSAKATAQYLGLKSGQSVLLCLPAKFIAGKMMIVRALVLGLDLHYIKPSVDAAQNIVRDFDFCAMIPMQVQYAFDHQMSDQLHRIENLIIGGAAISSSLKDSIKSLKNSSFATYGMTETITHIALQKLNGENKSDYFQCLPNVKVGVDERACLTIESEVAIKRKIITNDVAELVSDTQFKILGRADFVINSGGLKIFPESLEAKISHLIPVAFSISSKKDEILGEKVVLLIEKEKPLENEKEIMIEIRKALTSNQAPKEIVYISKLFYTGNQKLDRKKNQAFVNK